MNEWHLWYSCAQSWFVLFFAVAWSHLVCCSFVVSNLNKEKYLDRKYLLENSCAMPKRRFGEIQKRWDRPEDERLKGNPGDGWVDDSPSGGRLTDDCNPQSPPYCDDKGSSKKCLLVTVVNDDPVGTRGYLPKSSPVTRVKRQHKHLSVVIVLIMFCVWQN